MKKDMIQVTQKTPHTPTRKAKIGIGSNFNSQTFEYANGTPGDLMVPITSSEIKTWKHIVRAVNAHEDMLLALSDCLQRLERCPDKLGDTLLIIQIKEAIARAEGE